MSDIDTAAEGLARLALVGQVAEEHVDKIVPHVADRYRTSLDALYRDIVPLLHARDMYWNIDQLYPLKDYLVRYVAQVGPWKGASTAAEAVADTPAEALCLAAWAALRGEG